MTHRVPRVPVHSPAWVGVYTHPDKPTVEVTVRSNDEPQDTRMFLVAGGPTLLHLTRKEHVNKNTTNKESTDSMPTQTRKRPRTGTKRSRPAPEPELVEDDDLDVDDLDDLDVDDLDLEDEGELDIEDDADDLDEEDEDSDDIEDEAEFEDEEDEDEIEEADDDLDDEPEDEADDDLGDLDDLDEDDIEEEPAPPKRTRSTGKKSAAKAPAKAKSGDRPLTDAQSKMLKAAVKNKTGAKVANIGQKRTADSLAARKLVKWAETEPNGGVVIGTAKGAKEIGADGVAYVKPEPKAEAPKKSSGAKKSGTRSRSTGKKSSGSSRKAPSGNGLPKGMFGVASVAKAAGGVHEETVRRVLRMNDDRWEPVDGRWQFTKDEAREVVREVRSYIKYTGGTRGRPKGATTQLPDGKVGPATIAEMAGVHRNTVYNFLHKHEARFERFKNEEGLYLFTETQAQKVAAKIAG